MHRVIGFLRFLGLTTVAVWLGAAVFFVFGAEPAASSQKMLGLIGQNNFPFFSVAIGQLIASRFLYLYTICAAIAVAHMAAEWLYLGKYPSSFWLGLLVGLCLLGLAQGWIVRPAIADAHQLQFRSKAPIEQREHAARTFKVWRGVSVTLNYMMVAGLGIYFWRVGNPNDPMRFVSARQFRS